MTNPKTMTKFECVTEGLRILQSYLSRENKGDICAEHDVIAAHGIHRDALGGNDRIKLEAMCWWWDEDLECWAKVV